MIPFISNVQERQIDRDRKYITVAWGVGWEWRLIVNRHDRSHWGDENVLKLIYGDDYTTWLTEHNVHLTLDRRII